MISLTEVLSSKYLLDISYTEIVMRFKLQFTLYLIKFQGKKERSER